MKTVTPATPGAHSDELAEWLASHNIVAQDTYKLEIYPNTGMMTVYQFALDEDGKKYVYGRGMTKEDAMVEFGDKAGEVAVKDPYDVRMKTSLPEVVKC